MVFSTKTDWQLSGIRVLNAENFLSIFTDVIELESDDIFVYYIFISLLYLPLFDILFIF